MHNDNKKFSDHLKGTRSPGYYAKLCSPESCFSLRLCVRNNLLVSWWFRRISACRLGLHQFLFCILKWIAPPRPPCALWLNWFKEDQSNVQSLMSNAFLPICACLPAGRVFSPRLADNLSVKEHLTAHLASGIIFSCVLNRGKEVNATHCTLSKRTIFKVCYMETA